MTLARLPILPRSIGELQVAGNTTLRTIAAGLNERGIPTATSHGEWSAVQVRRILARLAC
jgi:hypothetical protein